MSGEGGLTSEELWRVREATALPEAQILRLHQAFVRLRPDATGSISAGAFSRIPLLSFNPLLGRVLAVLNINGAGQTDFMSFVKALTVFSPRAGKHEKLQFTYKMYDIDGDGRISNKDLLETLKIMVGPNLTEAQLQQIVNRTFIEVDLNRDGYVTFDEFEKLPFFSDLGDRLKLSI